jgi:hypothetical protein
MPRPLPPPSRREPFEHQVGPHHQSRSGRGSRRICRHLPHRRLRRRHLHTSRKPPTRARPPTRVGMARPRARLLRDRLLQQRTRRMSNPPRLDEQLGLRTHPPDAQLARCDDPPARGLAPHPRMSSRLATNVIRGLAQSGPLQVTGGTSQKASSRFRCPAARNRTSSRRPSRPAHRPSSVSSSGRTGARAPGSDTTRYARSSPSTAPNAAGGLQPPLPRQGQVRNKAHRRTAQTADLRRRVLRRGLRAKPRTGPHAILPKARQRLNPSRPLSSICPSRRPRPSGDKSGRAVQQSRGVPMRWHRNSAVPLSATGAWFPP